MDKQYNKVKFCAIPHASSKSLEQAAFWHEVGSCVTYRPPLVYTMQARLNITDQSSIVCCCCCCCCCFNLIFVLFLFLFNSHYFLFLFISFTRCWVSNEWMKLRTRSFYDVISSWFNWNRELNTPIKRLYPRFLYHNIKFTFITPLRG